MIGTQQGCRSIEIEFFENLEKLDKGEQAMLKRNAGNSLAEAHGVAWFYRLIPAGMKEWNHEHYFLVATLYCISHKSLADGNMGVTLRTLQKKVNPDANSQKKASKDAIERRFSILLDADIDNGSLAFRLRQLVKLAASHDVGIDWPQLLKDICNWSHPKKYVQKSWAMSFYTPELTGKTNNEGAKNAN